MNLVGKAEEREIELGRFVLGFEKASQQQPSSREVISVKETKSDRYEKRIYIVSFPQSSRRRGHKLLRPSQ